MFHVYMSLFVVALFYVMTPGILVTLPKNGSKVTVALTHAVLFALVFHLTHKMVWKYFYGPEGFASADGAAAEAKAKACPQGTEWNVGANACVSKH